MAKRPKGTSAQGELELVHYESPDCSADLSLDTVNETVWATQAQIAALFGVDRSVITKHLGRVFEERELEEDSVCAKFAHTAADGKTYLVQHYNLDAVLSVGYRVSSKKATEFRRWATQTLRQYLEQGFALNEARLRSDPTALRELAAQVRKMRAEELNVYGAVRDVFAFGSSDYDGKAIVARSFYARLQDKFLFAITGSTSAEIILARADHLEVNMGLQTMAGNRPSLDDAKVGKNYLDEDELYGLHILCEQFLLFVESKALRGQKLTMAELAAKFDDLLRLQGHQVFSEYRDYLRDRAVAHAKRELAAYRERLTRQGRNAPTFPAG